jgi:hypothetical protein
MKNAKTHHPHKNQALPNMYAHSAQPTHLPHLSANTPVVVSFREAASRVCCHADGSPLSEQELSKALQNRRVAMCIEIMISNHPSLKVES